MSESMQQTLDGRLIHVDPPRPIARTYRFRAYSVPNIIDQVVLTTDYKKSEFVADAIRLGGLYVALAGADALRSVSRFESWEELIAFFNQRI